MEESALTLTLGFQYSESSRFHRLHDELAFALSRTDRAALAGWGRRAGGRLVELGARRVGGLAQLLRLAGRAGARELVALYRAARAGTAWPHLGDRTAAAIDGTLELGRDGARGLATLGRMLRDQPRENAPRVLGALLGFSAGSGGLDGNGGVPDLDLLWGIEMHRSPLTHTLIAGIVLEGLLLALADLATVVHERLPHERDPLWDELARIGGPLTDGLATGGVAGLAYHLLVDAFVQPGALHGLPVDGLPLEVHQAIIGGSGAAEAVRAGQRIQADEPVDIDQHDPARKTPGRRMVDSLGDAGAKAQAALADAFAAVKQKFQR